MDETGRVVGGRRPLPPAEVAALLPGRNAVPGGGSAVLVHRTLLDRTGPFDTRLHNTEDWDLWVRLSRLELPRWVPAPMVGYRVHGGGSSLLTRQIVRGAQEIERRYGGPLDRVTLYRHLGRLSARGGRRGEAIRGTRGRPGGPRVPARPLLLDVVQLLGPARAAGPPDAPAVPGAAGTGSCARRIPLQAQEWLDELA